MSVNYQKTNGNAAPNSSDSTNIFRATRLGNFVSSENNDIELLYFFLTVLEISIILRLSTLTQLTKTIIWDCWSTFHKTIVVFLKYFPVVLVEICTLNLHFRGPC